MSTVSAAYSAVLPPFLIFSDPIFDQSKFFFNKISAHQHGLADNFTQFGFDVVFNGNRSHIFTATLGIYAFKCWTLGNKKLTCNEDLLHPTADIEEPIIVLATKVS